jgi:hypothetical protein
MVDRPYRRWWLPALHILGLWALAVAQPILDLLGPHPEFFIAHSTSPADLVIAVAGLVLAVPLLPAILVWFLGGLAPRVGAGVLATAVALGAGAIAMLVLKEAGVQTAAVAMPLATLAGVLAAWAYGRVPAVRTFATALSLAIIVVPVVFVTQPGIRGLLAAPARKVEAGIRTRPDAPPPAPVLLVILDETPLLSLLDGGGRIDPVLYPHLAQLAHDGVWFRNATTVSDDTRWAVPAILSGLYPRASLTPTQSDYPHTLFTQLAATHRLEVVESTTRLCQLDACTAVTAPLASRLAAIADDLRILYLHRLLPDDLRHTLPDLTTDWARWGLKGAVERQRRRGQAVRVRRADRDLHTAIRFVERIASGGAAPAFYFLHTLLPHSPWQWLPSGQRNATRTPVLDAAPGARESDWGVAQLQQRHLMQSQLMDAFLGRYLGRLKDAGLYERALVVVTADHGVSFKPGAPRRAFTDSTAAEIMRVPLLVKFPGGRGGVPGVTETGGQAISDRNAESIDIAPTVLDILGFEAASAQDGRSLRRPLADERPSKTIVCGTDGQRRTFPPHGLDLTPVLRAKTARFGAGDNRFRVPAPPRFARVVGRDVSSIRVEDGAARVSIDALGSFLDFRATEDSAPFDVAGRFVAGRPGGEMTWVAVAVNGKIRAVTRTWDAAPDRWLATPPLDAWRPGRNQIEVFVIGGSESAPVLARASLVTATGEEAPVETSDESG